MKLEAIYSVQSFSMDYLHSICIPCAFLFPLLHRLDETAFWGDFIAQVVY